MAVPQATVVHEGVQYDVEVDTTSTEALDCARTSSRSTCHDV
jgi:chloramphenicol 3-O phosphotransferase